MVVNSFLESVEREISGRFKEHHHSKEEGLSKVSEGDVVLVHEDNVKRSNWKMGKVVGLITGKDGEVRGAKLKLITKGKAIFVNRALQKLYPLEVCSVTTECQNQTNELNTNLVGNEGSHLRVGKSHNRQLSWIRVGKHKPCSITNCLLFWQLL